jgi:hypothetical protein
MRTRATRRLAGLVIVLGAAGFSLPSMALDVVFEGTPNVKVEVAEGTSETTRLRPERAKELTVRITKTATGYAWSSRNNVPMTRTESGAYVTYMATTGAGYVRVLSPAMRKALEALPKEKRDKEFTYMEHMTHQLGSVTYFGN